ncbi:MAG: zinc ribbon domain-containing protein [Clostridia bacterium]|nr:zinc ribbon domain-containing protein [Clostridia bacterium]
MPTGFSSHGGGHSSGGGHFGGFHSSSLIVIPGSRGGKAKPGTVWFIFFGLALFLTIFLSFIYVSESNFMKTRETDFERFHTLAEEGVVVDGYVEDHGQGGENRWYFSYRFKATNGDWIPGYSYTLYSKYDLLRDYPKGSRFDLVVESGEITENTESVPLDFRSKTLDFDGDYVAAKNSTSTLLPTIIVVGLAGAFCLTMGIIAVTKAKKKEEVGTSTQTIVDKTETKQTEEKQEELKVCEYCGTYIPPKTMKCPNCGASQKK